MNFKKYFKKYWLFFILIIFLFLKLPCLFEPFTYADEAIYLTLGQAFNKDLVWYRDIHDNKPPMIYLVAALAHNFPAYRLIHFSWSLITILAFWQLAKLVFPKNKLATGLTTMVFTVLTSLHSFEGNVANAENFMLLPIIAGFYLIYELLTCDTPAPSRQSHCFSTIRSVFKLPTQKNTLIKRMLNSHLKNNKSHRWVWFLAGFLFSIAFLFKIPAGFDFAAAIVFIFLGFMDSKKKNYQSLIINYSIVFFGFFTPILITLVYYFTKGALGQYLTATFFQNLPYLSSWAADQPQAGGLPMLMVIRGLAVMGLVIALHIFRKKTTLAVKLVLAWFGFTWFAALLSSRPYPHYLIQILPPLALAFGLASPPSLKLKTFYKHRRSWYSLSIPFFLSLIFYLTFNLFKFWTYPNLEYYLNFYRYLFGFQSHQEYWHTFDSQSESIYQTAAYLRTRTQPEEKIFIWGTQPSIYALARRLPVGRYTTAYHIIDFNGYQETIDALNSSLPQYLLVTQDEKCPFSQLDDFINHEYLIEKVIGNFKIYRLAATNNLSKNHHHH